MSYTSYYTFLSDNMKIIKDVRADFTAAGLSGEDFDKQYTSFINRLTKRCRTFSEDSFNKSSKLISCYVSDVSKTTTLSQTKRFEQLISITDTALRKVM